MADKTCSFPVILVSWRNSWLNTFPILNSENSMYLDKLPGRKNSKFRHGWSCLYSISPSNLTRTIFSLLQSMDFCSLDVTVVDSKTTVWFWDLTFGTHEIYCFWPIIWSEGYVWLKWCWRRNVLATTLRCWWRFRPFLTPTRCWQPSINTISATSSVFEH